MDAVDWGVWSLLPLLVTLVLAFATRSALLAMLAGTFFGTLMLGAAPGVGLNELFQASLGTPDFIWIVQIVILIGVLFELFKRAGVLVELAGRFSNGGGSRRRVSLSAWCMGFFIVDDYFSPLLTGAVMRPMSDRAGIPREKLAFILDSTTASVCILVPFTAWGAYLSSLIAAQGGPVSSVEEGLTAFIHAIPYNFYPLLLVLFTLLICLGVIPDFGPMRNAERRAAETGALLRPGARPLVSEDDRIDGGPADRIVESVAGNSSSLMLELLIPIVLLIGFGAWTLVATGSVKIVEAFLLVNSYLFAVLALRRRFRDAQDAAEVIVAGAKSVTAALLIIALAYALNAITAQLEAAQFIIDQFADDLTPNSVVVLTFLIAAAMSFATGTSWGTYALMVPVALPLAFEFSGGELTPLVYQTIAAIAGGGIFGDHASPVSDTSVLSSVGAGSDHIDHVVTQLPYALSVAALTVAIYLLV